MKQTPYQIGFFNQIFPKISTPLSSRPKPKKRTHRDVVDRSLVEAIPLYSDHQVQEGVSSHSLPLDPKGGGRLEASVGVLCQVSFHPRSPRSVGQFKFVRGRRKLCLVPECVRCWSPEKEIGLDFLLIFL